MQSKWSPRTLTRYILLQLPVLGVLIVLFIISLDSEGISSRLMLLLIILNVVKDVILYPFLWKSYQPDAQQSEHPMAGLTGVVTESLNPEGYIKIRGELWQARSKSERKIKKGEKVTVINNHRLLLIVKPWTNQKDSQTQK